MAPGPARGDSPGGARPRDEAGVSDKAVPAEASAAAGLAGSGPPPPAHIDDEFDPKQWLSHTATDVRESFARGRRRGAGGGGGGRGAAAPGRRGRAAAQY